MEIKSGLGITNTPHLVQLENSFETECIHFYTDLRPSVSNRLFVPENNETPSTKNHAPRTRGFTCAQMAP